MISHARQQLLVAAGRKRAQKAQPEFDLQCTIAQWLRLQYPDVMFLSDVRAALKLTIPQQVRQKKIQCDGFACPDLMIFLPVFGWEKNYHGFFAELKAESPYRKDGCLKADRHLSEQLETIERLRELGYHADFYWEFEQFRLAFNRYNAERALH